MIENKIVTNDWILNTKMHLLCRLSWGFSKDNHNWLFTLFKIIFELKHYSVRLRPIVSYVI